MSGTAQDLKLIAIKELAKRRLESLATTQRESLYEFVKFYWENEKKTPLEENWHIKLICETLEKVYT